MKPEQIVSLEKFLAHSDEFVEQLQVKGSPFILTKNDSAVAVIQNVEEYKKLLDAFSMLRLLIEGEKEIREGKGRDQSEVFANLDRILESEVG